jgi:hypothetical protein
MALIDRVRVWANEPVVKTVGTLAAVWSVLLVTDEAPWSIDDFHTVLAQVIPIAGPVCSPQRVWVTRDPLHPPASSALRLGVTILAVLCQNAAVMSERAVVVPCTTHHRRSCM